MKKFMMLAATMVALSGSNAFAVQEVGNVNAGTSNCDPSEKGCHNEAAGPSCPLQSKVGMFAKTNPPADAPAVKSARANGTVQ